MSESQARLRKLLSNILEPAIPASDLVAKIYDEVLTQAQSTGLDFALMYKTMFNFIPPKEALNLSFWLPQASRVIIVAEKKDKPVKEDPTPTAKTTGDQPLQKPKSFTEAVNIREWLHNYFMFFVDDEIEITAKYNNKLIYQATGKIGKLTYLAENLLAHKIKSMDIIKVNIKLLQKGAKRIEVENKSLLETSEYLDFLGIESLKTKLLKMPEDFRVKRLALWPPTPGDSETQIKALTTPFYATQDVIAIEAMVKAFSDPEKSNQQVLESDNLQKRQSLEKLRDWLTQRFDGDYSAT